MITLTIGKGVYCECLPQSAKDKIHKDLTFVNPDYVSAKKHGNYVSKSMPPKLYFFAFDNAQDLYWVPRGYMYYLKRFLKFNDYKVKVIDRTLLLPKIDIEFQGELRDYQATAVTEMSTRYPVGVLEASTGAGKTVCATGIIAERKQPTLVIVHNKELLYQWQGAIKQFLDYDCGLLGDGKCDLKPITVGIINSVKIKADQLYPLFGQVIVDECFPAGTKVDGKPIEEIKVGDYVNSFNHKAGKIEKKRVAYLFKKVPETLCTVKLQNGKEITCTENHPFYTNRGYLTASKLNASLSVLDIDQHQNSEAGNGKNSNEEVLCLRENSKMPRIKTLENFANFCQKKQCEMFGGMCSEKTKGKPQKRSRISEGVQQRTCQQKDERTKSYAQQKVRGKDESNKTCKRYSEYLEWYKRWEWKSNSTTRKNCDCPRVGDGSCCKNSRPQTKKSQKDMVQKEECSYIVQNRCGEQGFENSNRDRRKFSFWEEENSGQEERVSFKMERVESVTFHKQTSESEFRELCKDGHVYNIEVENNNNYFVDGILVHNCHRVASTVWTETLQSFPARHYLGLSATPFRRDGLGKAINAYIGPKIHVVDKEMLHDTGAVMKPTIIRVNTNFSQSFTEEREDRYATMISKLAKDSARNSFIASSISNDYKQYGQNILVVSDRVAHCKEIAHKLQKIGIDSRVLSGKVSSENRTQIVNDVRNGKCKVLIATLSLIGEGFDAPSLSSLHLTSPVKFSGRLLQVVGRVLRPEEGKVPRVYDYRDPNVGVLRNTGFARDRIYKKQWG